ncbi:MAG: glycosyltransferase [Selenomonas sp.]|nr:glycosyltransferase [Selenomonas sp.]
MNCMTTRYREKFLPHVSVIIPIYDAVKSLSTCLSSIQNQSLKAIEIILVDDGSIDGSCELCDKAALADRRIKVIHQENLGLPEARKSGLRVATGHYVTFVDADDWIEQELCECLYDAVRDTGAEIAVAGHFMDEKDCSCAHGSCLKPGFYDRERLEQEVWPILFHNDFESDWSVYPYLCGKLFLREKLVPWQEKVEADIGLGEDVCVTFPYLLHASSMVIIEKPLYHYVQHGGSMMRRRLGEKDMVHFRQIYRLVGDSLPNLPQSAELKRQLRQYMLTCILIPRSPWLLPEMKKLPYLFPFRDVPQGSQIIIYGAGVFGQALHDFLEYTSFASCILWLDARAALLRDEGLEVFSLQEISALPRHDYLLIPIMNSHTVEVVRRDLLTMGAEQNKIRCLDETFIASDEVWEIFGMEADYG